MKRKIKIHGLSFFCMIGLFISQCTIFEQEYADITGICR